MPGERRIQVPLTMVWSKQSDTNAVFIPLTPAIRTAGMKNVRPTQLEVRGNTGAARVAMAWQISNEDDEADWGTTTDLSTVYVSTEGLTYDGTFQDLSGSLTKRFIRFGIACKDTAGNSTQELAYAGFIVDIRES